MSSQVQGDEGSTQKGAISRTPDEPSSTTTMRSALEGPYAYHQDLAKPAVPNMLTNSLRRNKASHASAKLFRSSECSSSRALSIRNRTAMARVVRFRADIDSRSPGKTVYDGQ